MSKAIVLLSGGIDSAVVTAMLLAEGHEVFTLTFNYGQRNVGETIAAKMLSEKLGATYHEEIRFQNISTKSALMNKASEVPKNRTMAEIESGIPTTYVPARNTIFLSYALGFAETRGANYIAVGAVGDESETTMMPDCEPAYFEAFEVMANLATKASMQDGQRIRIITPLINMQKDEVFKKGVELGVPFKYTLTCYDPISRVLACGQCDACIIRKDGFKKAGIQDPTSYGIRK